MKNKKIIRMVAMLLALALCAALPPIFPAAVAGARVGKLQAECMDDPLGIDVPRPRLSWQMESDARAQTQSAYQIIVSQSPDKVREGTGDVWDTGKVPSSSSCDLPYDGPALLSKTRYYWSVRVWDQDGQASAYAPPAFFETAMLQDSDWTARWITVEDETDALYPSVSIDLASRNARYVKLDCTKLGIPLDGDGCRLQLAEIQVFDRTGQNVALGCPVASNDTYSNGWWEPEFLVDGERSSGTGQNGFTSNGHGSPNTNIWVELDLQEVKSISRVVIYARNDVKASQGEKVVNFPASYTLQTAGADKSYAVAHTATDQPAPAFTEYDPSLPVFGKSFGLSKTVKKARAYASGLGMFELQVNGRPVTDAVFEPGETNFDKRALYVTYDITDLLRQGDNTVGAYIGKGFYYNPATPGRYNRSPKTWGPLMLLAQIEIEYTDGQTQVIGTDGSWKYCKGPLTESSWLGGEDYDARRELTGFGQPDYAYEGWQDALLVDALPFETLSARMYPSIRTVEQIDQPVITELPGQVYVVDFGINHAGTFTFTGNLAAGQRVEFWPGETLNPDGTVSQQSIGNGPVWDSYTAAGGQMTYTPKFVYHGYRYLEIRGLTEKPDPSQITGNIVHCDNEETGSFVTSDPVINQVHTLITRSIADNMYNVLTDCPHREKLGWMEVAQLLFNSIAANYDVGAWYQNFSNMIMDAQKDSGSIPSVVPPLTAGHGAHMLSPGPDDTPNDPTWCGAGVLIPWYLYQTYGNADQLSAAFGSMEAYMDYLSSLVEKNKPYILESEDVNRDLGDWYALEHTSVTFVITCTYYQLCDAMRQAALVLGESGAARKYAGLADKVKEAINQTFFNRTSMSYDTGSQTANGLPLYLGIVPADCQEGVLASLIRSVEANNDHLTSGEVGLKYVLAALSDNGRADLAYRMVTNRTLPSYYYLASIGKTSLTEPWDGRTTDSQNHCMLGHGEGWLFEYLGGLRNAGVGYDHSLIAPYIPDDLTSADVSVSTRYGQLRCAWTRQGGSITLEAYVPANTTATVRIPALDLSVVTEGGKAVAEAEGVRSVSFEEGEAVIEVGSGHYSFASRRQETLYPGALQSLLAAAKGLQKENVARHYLRLAPAVSAAEESLRTASTQAELDEAAAGLSAVLASMQFKGNLALGKPTSASSSIENSDWSAANLTDGDLRHGALDAGAGYSSSNDEYNPHSEWVEVDLLAVSRISRVELYPRHFSGEIYSFPKNFTIQVSTDGRQWQTVVEQTDYPLVTYGAIPFAFDAVEGRYVRFRADALHPNPVDGGRYRLQLAELEVYDDTPQTLQEALENARANLSDLTPDNSLTAESFLEAALQGVINPDIKVEWETPFTLRKATDDADGSITGSLRLAMEGKAQTLEIDLAIPKPVGPDIVPGDMDKDDVVTIQDVMEACKVLARKSAGKEPTEDEMMRGNLDGDNAFTINDVMEICKILARKA